MNNRFFCIYFLFFVIISTANTQQIVTAEKFLEQVSNKYAAFDDYEARIVIRSGNVDMYGAVVHKTPNLLRIDFTSPAGQVIVFNGNMLTVYLPEYRAILKQSVRSSGANMATQQGLSMMRRNFAAAYITGPEPAPIDDGSREKAVKLRLTRRYGSEGFREIILSVDPASLLIRRMQGTTIADNQIQFDFSDIKTNQGISERRFLEYESPGSANLYNDFLFRDIE